MQESDTKELIEKSETSDVVVDISQKTNIEINDDKVRKYGSLVVLCVTNSASMLMIHCVRSTTAQQLFLITTAVFFQEIFKVVFCLIILLFQEKSFGTLGHLLYDRIIKQPLDTVRISVPAFLYIVQNNLVFVALSNLDAATFQVLYQVRVITTAFFSVALLGRKLSYIQWASLASLFIGLSIVQLQINTTNSHPGHQRNSKLGFIAVIAAANTSGFAGVYFEKILKGTGQSVWLSNIQLGTIGIVISAVSIFIKDYKTVSSSGFLVGYTYLVWITIVLQAVSGLSVAAVIKYADNILKTFATAIAIVISCFISYFLFHFTLTFNFVCGSIIVITSGFTYGKFVYDPPSAA